MQFTECTLQKCKYFLISNVWYETVLMFAIWILKNENNCGYQKFEEKYDIKKLNQIRYHEIETNVISKIWHIFDIIAFELRWYHNILWLLISKISDIVDIKLLISQHSLVCLHARQPNGTVWSYLFIIVLSMFVVTLVA